MKKALVATNDLYDFAGSGILALEVAECLLGMGFGVEVLGNASSRKMVESTDPRIKVTDGSLSGRASQYDFIWTQHNMIALSGGELMRLREGSACIVSAHLSFYSLYEFLGAATGLLLNAHMVANCGRSAEALADRCGEVLKPGMGIDPDRIVNFRNAAPKKFLSSPSPSPSLRRLLIVSNHPPEELLGAVEILKRSNVEAKIHGMLHDARKRIAPEDIEQADAVATIAKTVQYSIMGGKPVYCYDYFGGPGWLGEGNFDKAEHFGFTGGCCKRKLPAEAIAKEILEGYPKACEQAVALHERHARDYVLEDFIARIREAPRPNLGPEGCVRASLATLHYNALHIREFYRNRIIREDAYSKLLRRAEELEKQLISLQKLPPPAGDSTLSGQ